MEVTNPETILLAVILAISLTTLFVASRAVVWAKRGAQAKVDQLTTTTQNMDMHVGFADEHDHIAHLLEAKEGSDFALIVTNLGSSPSDVGKITITVGPALSATPSIQWTHSAPHATMPDGSQAWTIEVPRLTANEKYRPPLVKLDAAPGRSGTLASVLHRDYIAEYPIERAIFWEISIEGRGEQTGRLNTILRQ